MYMSILNGLQFEILLIQEFTGNTDQDTVVYHKLNPFITTRYIRFLPVAWIGNISMRVELYGCKQDTRSGITIQKPILTSKRCDT